MMDSSARLISCHDFQRVGRFVLICWVFWGGEGWGELPSASVGLTRLFTYLLIALMQLFSNVYTQHVRCVKMETVLTCSHIYSLCGLLCCYLKRKRERDGERVNAKICTKRWTLEGLTLSKTCYWPEGVLKTCFFVLSI